ncbi:hypothetical protein [Microvirga tunisiensis]|uniref:Uncharacterized protein n=1 Tax=Microvirga tunisiensis TaxID=2108360 RepID=A0A5N7MRS7_9HYPH|nr:hypothetical protein [Microvirga tunisiensis]MPR09236.1 hypothetical protein [Microvirga tunisiensis]MPR29702.1 hypothetical protein [Microvirga tunisiensis]
MVLDDKLISLADRTASYLQEEHGVSLPMILREATLGTMVSFIALIVTSFMDGHKIAGYFLLLPVLWSLIQLYTWFKGFARDAEQGWSDGLSNRYIREAQKQRIAYGFARVIFFIGFSMAFGSFVMNMIHGKPLTIYGASHALSLMLLTSLFYLRCALPKPPGRRRTKQLIPAFSGSAG